MKNLRYHFVLFLVSLIYGATFTIAKDVMPDYVKSYAFIAMRVGAASVLFWLVHSLFVRESIKTRSDYIEFFIAGFFGVAANMTMFFKGLETSFPINGAALMLAAPVFVLIFQKMVYKVRILPIQWLGILLALTGAFLLIAGKGLSFSKATWQGDLLILLNAISYAFYLVYVKRLLDRYHYLTVAKWAFTFAFILVLPIGFNQLQEVDYAALPTKIWGEIAFVLVCTTFLTYFLNAYAIKNTSSSLVGSYIYLQPLLATIIAVNLRGDQLTIEQFSFGLLIFAGVYLVSRKKR